MNLREIRKSIFIIINPSSSKKGLSYIFDVFIITLIILNVLAVIIESIPEIKTNYSSYFYQFELVSVIIFSVEYILRLWTCVEFKKYEPALWGRIRWIITPFAIIDLFAILPFYLPFIGLDLRFIRIFRLFRIFRLLKIARYTNALDLIGRVLKNKKEELFITLVFCLILLIVSATFMYYAENEAQPGTFTSIPDALWWAVITLTSVGYGDIYPVTGLGKILAGIISLIGIGLIALPTGILASGFSDELGKIHENTK